MINLIFILMLFTSNLFAIDGGDSVKKGDFPAIVKFNNPKNDGSIYCTGTLIAPNIVITAAHCVEKGFFKYLRVSKAGDNKGELGSLFKKNFKVKNVFYLDESKTVYTEIEMIKDYIRGKGFRSSTYHNQIQIRESLRVLEEKKINVDIAFLELSENQEISADQLLKLSCDQMPEGSDILMLGYGKNLKELSPNDGNPLAQLQQGNNFYFVGNYQFEKLTGNLVNSGDSGGPLLLKNNPDMIYGIASFKTINKDGNNITSSYSSTSSYWARKLYLEISLSPNAPEALKDIVEPCM